MNHDARFKSFGLPLNSKGNYFVRPSTYPLRCLPLSQTHTDTVVLWTSVLSLWSIQTARLRDLKCHLKAIELPLKLVLFGQSQTTRSVCTNS